MSKTRVSKRNKKYRVMHGAAFKSKNTPKSIKVRRFIKNLTTQIKITYTTYVSFKMTRNPILEQKKCVYSSSTVTNISNTTEVF